MSIDINELIVNATLEDACAGDQPQKEYGHFLQLEEIKAQIITECLELFHEFLEKEKDR
jgi:hypothetical protein